MKTVYKFKPSDSWNVPDKIFRVNILAVLTLEKYKYDWVVYQMGNYKPEIETAYTLSRILDALEASPRTHETD